MAAPEQEGDLAKPTARDTLEATMWDATASPEPETGPLDGRVEADVAIVGGGITGMSTALHLAEAGQKVAVLEAERVGWGASSRNTGHMASAWTSMLPDEVIGRF